MLLLHFNMIHPSSYIYQYFQQFLHHIMFAKRLLGTNNVHGLLKGGHRQNFSDAEIQRPKSSEAYRQPTGKSPIIPF